MSIKNGAPCSSSNERNTKDGSNAKGENKRRRKSHTRYVKSVNESPRRHRQMLKREQWREEVKGRQSPILREMGLSRFPDDYCQPRRATGEKHE